MKYNQNVDLQPQMGTLGEKLTENPINLHARYQYFLYGRFVQSWERMENGYI